MKVAISGSSGLVGTALRESLRAAGHEVLRMVRGGAQGADRILWSPQEGQLRATDLAGVDAIVHLAGENVAGGRWSESFKRRILKSRVEGTRLLSETLAKMDKPPAVLLSASAVGYYGDRGDRWMKEDDAPGEGFLAEVCQRWEEATDPARECGLRVVHLRTGIVLSRQGGALGRMLPPFRLGLGGVLGSGEQSMSWIGLDDLVAAIRHAMDTPSLHGPLNMVSPEPVTNRRFTKVLGRALGRPTLFGVPAAMIRVVFGEMGKEMLLASTRVSAERLLGSGFEFRFPGLEELLKHELRS